jgi:hypothetical protein
VKDCPDSSVAPQRGDATVIARRVWCSKNTVRAAFRRDVPPKYERQPRGWLVDAVEPRIRELLAVTPTMPATVIAERIGWSHSITILKDRVRVLRPFYVPRIHRRGRRMSRGIGQCDLWFPPVDIPLGHGQVVTCAIYTIARLGRAGGLTADPRIARSSPPDHGSSPPDREPVGVMGDISRAR